MTTGLQNYWRSSVEQWADRQPSSPRQCWRKAWVISAPHAQTERVLRSLGNFRTVPSDQVGGVGSAEVRDAPRRGGAEIVHAPVVLANLVTGHSSSPPSQGDYERCVSSQLDSGMTYLQAGTCLTHHQANTQTCIQMDGVLRHFQHITNDLTERDLRIQPSCCSPDVGPGRAGPQTVPRTIPDCTMASSSPQTCQSYLHCDPASTKHMSYMSDP